MSNFDKVVTNWVLTKTCRPRSRYEHKKKSGCYPIGNISDIKFGDVDLGYCETCSYVISTIVFEADCSCGEKYMRFYLVDYDMNLTDLLKDILDFEEKNER